MGVRKGVESMVRNVRIDERTWSFEEEGVRFFLLEGEDRALLIDSGMETRNARDLAEGLTGRPVELLNTHADMDHIGSNGQFESFYMSPAEATNYYKCQGGAGRFVPIWDGDIIDLGDRPLMVIAMPGHTPGSVAVLDIHNRRLFSGDPVQDGRIFMFGPQRQMDAYLASLERLLTMAGQFDEIYPSHGSRPLRPGIIEELIGAAREIIAGRARGKKTTVFGKSVLAVVMGVATFLCDGEQER